MQLLAAVKRTLARWAVLLTLGGSVASRKRDEDEPPTASPPAVYRLALAL